MSYSNDDDDYITYSADDICISIAAINASAEAEAEHEERRERLEFYWREERKSFIQAIAHLQTKEEILSTAIRKIIDNNLEKLISTYTVSQRLKPTFSYLARQPDSLPKLISGALKESFSAHNSTPPVIQKNTLGTDTDDRIDSLCRDIYTNSEREIVYVRVSKIQRFVHQIVDERLGPGKYLQLNRILMQQLLSACRLHLNLHDIKKLPNESLIDMVQRSAEASEQELKTPLPVNLPPGKTYDPTRRVSHLQSLLQIESYSSVTEEFALLNFINEIWAIRMGKYAGDFKKALLQKYRQYVFANQ